MIDSHCHVDLARDPMGLASCLQSKLTGCVAVTMLPAHYELACSHLDPFPRVMPALGLHPLRAKEAHCQLSQFMRLARSARYIGEIGLDGSQDGRRTFALQKAIFIEALSGVRPKSFITVHSRGAWEEALEIVGQSGVGPVCFHYFTGGKDAVEAVIKEGHYLSVNHRMISANSKHRQMVAALRRDRILVESDAPFLGSHDPVAQIQSVYRFLARCWDTADEEVFQQIRENFERLGGRIGAPYFS